MSFNVEIDDEVEHEFRACVEESCGASAKCFDTAITEAVEAWINARKKENIN